MLEGPILTGFVKVTFSAPVLSEPFCLKFCAVLTAYAVVEMDCDTEYVLFSTQNLPCFTRNASQIR